jgi:hypothetical protein
MSAPIVLLTDGLPGTLRTRESVSSTAGRLFTPRHVNSVEATVEAGVPFAADNDAFNGGLDLDKWLSMLDKLEPFASSCAFVTIPDVVCDAPATFALWAQYRELVAGRGFTPALVLQNGMHVFGGDRDRPAGIRSGDDVIAWDEIGAIFVGGDDAYKDGVDVALIVFEARRRDVWVHVGRVNTRRRLAHAQALGASSVDGSGWVRFRSAMMPRLARWEEAGRPAELDLSDPFKATGFAAIDELEIKEGEAA